MARVGPGDWHSTTVREGPQADVVAPFAAHVSPSSAMKAAVAASRDRGAAVCGGLRAAIPGPTTNTAPCDISKLLVQRHL